MDFEIAFDFLKKLAKNNNREWFERNKAKYLEVKLSFEDFVGEVLHDYTDFDPSLAGQDPKKLVFRIYRDVRFSKDKRPYKKFISAGFSSQGKGTGMPGYYLQLEPGDKSFICCGLYAPGPEYLNKIRQEIDYGGEVLKSIVAQKSFKRYFPEFWDGDALKTAPKGYPKDHPHIEWIKLKSFVMMHSVSDADVKRKNFKKHLVAAMKAGKPFNDFLKAAMD